MRGHRGLDKLYPNHLKAEAVIEFMVHNQVKGPVKTIYLPVMVIFCGNSLVPTTPHGFRSKFRFQPAPNEHLLCSRASLPRLQVTHLLDRRGYFHRVKPLVKRRAFMGWFARVWDLTQVECALETMDPMNVGELMVEAKNWKNDSGRKMRRFLAKQNSESVFDEVMFKQAWEATYIPLPDSDWSTVFELGS